jgi:KaiC/GvpD/RAD55 family RecA-like ATPase
MPDDKKPEILDYDELSEILRTIYHGMAGEKQSKSFSEFETEQLLKIQERCKEGNADSLDFFGKRLSNWLIKNIEESTRLNADNNRIRTLADVIKNGIPEIKWTVQDIIPSRGVVFFGGPSGARKTWIAMHLALSVASGIKYLYHFDTKQAPVLYCDEENGDVTLPNRFGKLIQKTDFEKYQFDNLYLSIFNGIKLDNEFSIQQLRHDIVKYQPKVVILDSLVRCMEGEEDKATDVRKIFDNLKKLFEEFKEICFLILHHVSKGRNNKLEALRGSGDIGAFADIILMFSENKSFTNIEIVKHRFIDREKLPGFSVKFESSEDEDLNLIYYDQNPDQVDAEEECRNDLVDWMDEESIKVFQSGDGLKSMKDRGVSKSIYYKTLKKMVKDKDLRKLSHGKYENLNPRFSVVEEVSV